MTSSLIPPIKRSISVSWNQETAFRRFTDEFGSWWPSRFSPSAPAGQRGAEDNLILAIQEGKMLSFTWSAPPAFPDIRKQRTSVVIRLVPLGQDKTKLLFTQEWLGR